MNGPILSTAASLRAYLQYDLAHETREQVRILCLNAANRLLSDTVVSVGTVSEAPVYAREIVRHALDVGATALILIHNHPSGDPSPSAEDIAATRRVTDAARSVGIVLHDHLIVGLSGCTSMRAAGLIRDAGE